MSFTWLDPYKIAFTQKNAEKRKIKSNALADQGYYHRWARGWGIPPPDVHFFCSNVAHFWGFFTDPTQLWLQYMTTIHVKKDSQN